MALETFADGQVLTAAQLNTLSRQGVVDVAGQDERDQILSPNEGMIVYLRDVNRYDWYDGSAWKTFFLDTGWVNCTPGSGWTNSGVDGVPGVQIRRIGDLARMRGRLSGTLAAASTVTAVTLPSGFLPTATSNFNSIQSTGGYVGWCNVQSAGPVSVHFKSPYPGGTVVLEFTSVSFTYN